MTWARMISTYRWSDQHDGGKARQVSLVEVMLKLHKDLPKAKTPHGGARGVDRIPPAHLT